MRKAGCVYFADIFATVWLSLDYYREFYRFSRSVVKLLISNSNYGVDNPGNLRNYNRVIAASVSKRTWMCRRNQDEISSRAHRFDINAIRNQSRWLIGFLRIASVSRQTRQNSIKSCEAD